MKTISTEDRARYFTAYGFSTDFEAAVELGYSYDDAIRAICMRDIRIAAQFYTDELAFAFDSPKDEWRWRNEEERCSKVEADLIDDLDKLSTDTLAILAAVMTAKAGAN